MQCPICSSNDIKVIDSRQNKCETIKLIRRRRQCRRCGYRYTTYELTEECLQQLVMIKFDKKKEMIKQAVAKINILLDESDIQQ